MPNQKEIISTAGFPNYQGMHNGCARAAMISRGDTDFGKWINFTAEFRRETNYCIFCYGPLTPESLSATEKSQD